ncbi:conserved hypothetical protein [Histoplasma capsulatum var. duboisii H88]|uniref:Uncharacterized protein n=1 Tax=Ajellomyces capsulatus (strain H88) TaxID=544711 RepID=F0UJL1_AJEC8|nr:conserved hypothetical protein [Histoplasma capsulatum var. duboisii H88]
MSGNRHRDKLVDCEDIEVPDGCCGREPWAYRAEPNRRKCYPPNHQLAPQVERRSIGQDSVVPSSTVPRTVNYFKLGVLTHRHFNLRSKIHNARGSVKCLVELNRHSVYSGQRTDEQTQVHHVVEAGGGINRSAQNQQERNQMEGFKLQQRSHNFDPNVPQLNTRYHLSSTLEDQPLTAASRCVSDVGGYDRQNSNFQIGYRSGYSIQPQNDCYQPAAFTSPYYKNSNILGYNNIPSDLTYPLQPNVSPPAWSGKHCDQINYGDPLDAPSGVAASYQASTEGLEIDPARQIGPTDVSQRLDGNR